MKRFTTTFFSILIMFLMIGGIDRFSPSFVRADGFIDFENGVDGQPIRSSIPGLQFTTTQGYDWIYGDWRTGLYSGPYPNGAYYSNGNFFAWLGPNQGAGRIDFTEGCATYLQVWASSSSGLWAEAYYSDGSLASTASVGGNLGTGQLVRLRVDAPAGHCFNYVLLHDTGNYWLIDDLSTDAGGVPSTRPPVIIIPGIMGSILRNNDSCQNKDYEVWPDAATMLQNPFDPQLDHLKLANDGITPLSNCDHIYKNGIIKNISVGPFNIDFYAPLVDYLKQMGFSVYTFDYDWRLDLTSIANKLDDFINENNLTNNGANKVNIVDHSMGGLVARQYVISGTQRAAKVEQVVSIASPFLGAPKSLKALQWGDEGTPGLVWGAIGTYPPKIREISQNFPSVYQILPSKNYFDVNGGGYYSFDGIMKTWDETRSMILSDHNSTLDLAAENFHSNAMDDWWSTQTGVAFRLIIGSGKDTPGVLNERTVVSWDGGRVITYDIEPTDGDGTVPFRSAALNGNGYDYTGGVPIWYTKGLDHLGIIKEPYVMQFIGAMLATPPNTTSLIKASTSEHAVYLDAPILYKGSSNRFPVSNSIDAVPPTPPEMGINPFPLDGGQIAAFRVNAINVYDQYGNHTGPSADGSIESGIPGSGYTTMGDAIFVSVPSGSTYTVTVDAENNNDFDLRIRNLQGVNTQLIKRTIVYANVNADLAELHYLPNDIGTAPQLEIDTNNDGTLDSSMPPTGDLGADQSLDVTAPSINVNLQGQISPSGWYIGDVIVTITATDDLSGVAQILYSTNSGRAIQTYTTPFIVHSEQVPFLIVHATDLSGNQGSKKIGIGPSTYTISGNAGVGNAILSYTDGTSQTEIADAGGNYSINVTSTWSGTVTPSLTGYTFIPEYRTYSNVTENQNDQNFTAVLNGPPTPADFHVLDTTLTSIKMAWDNVSNESGYKIYKWLYLNNAWDFYYFTSVGANVTSFTDTPGSGNHFYQVSAYNSYGESDRATWIGGGCSSAGVCNVINGPSAPAAAKPDSLNNPPSIPALVAPKNKALTTNYRPRLDWSDAVVPGGSSFRKYELQLARDGSFSNAVSVEIVGSVKDSEYTPGEDLDPNTSYHWRVRAFDTFGQSSAWSSVRYFRTPIQPPILLDPGIGYSTNNRRPTFDWPDVAGASSYIIQVSNSSAFRISLIKAAVTNSSFTPVKDLPEGTLYWRVVAKGANGPGLWSEIRTFIEN